MTESSDDKLADDMLIPAYSSMEDLCKKWIDGAKADAAKGDRPAIEFTMNYGEKIIAKTIQISGGKEDIGISYNGHFAHWTDHNMPCPIYPQKKVGSHLFDLRNVVHVRYWKYIPV